MARVKGPLFSLDAAGSYAGQIRFRRGMGGVHVYTGGEPGRNTKKAPSAKQTAVRNGYRQARLAWGDLDESARDAWRLDARDRGGDLTGWNLFLAYWQSGLEMPDPPEPGDGGGDPVPLGPLTFPAAGLDVNLSSGSGSTVFSGPFPLSL